MEDTKNLIPESCNYEYQTLMSAMEVSVSKHLVDDYFTLVEANDYYYKIIGYPKEEYEAKFHNRPDLYYPYHGYDDELRRIADVVLDAIQKDWRRYSMITRMPIKGGGHIWVKLTGTFTNKFMNGYRISYTVITDINDLVQMQMEQSVTYNHIPGFVAKCLVQKNMEMELLNANDQFKAFFSIIPQPGIPTRITPQSLGDEDENLSSHMEYIQKGEPVRFSASIRNQSGRVLRVQITGECVDWIGDAPIYLFIFIDVTDLTDLQKMQKKLEVQAQQLQSALREAENASRAKSDFLSRMSHDIRTPMNAIVGMTEIAGAHLLEPQRVQDCLKKITTSSRHLLGLINDVLDMSKIESGQMVLRKEAMDLPEVMENIVTILQPMVKARKQRLSIRLRNLTHEHFICDSLRLHQCFINILSNASKFTPEGGSLSIEVEESASSKDGHAALTFTFSDTGMGIKEAFLPHIFDAFTREYDGRVDKTEGSGLGMAITKKIVDLMDGTISIQSQWGKGTTFLINLSLQINEVELDGFSLPPLRILVVDDDEIMCEYTTQTLIDCGVKAEWVTDGAEAIRRIQKAHQEQSDFKAVILDWQMPKQDGIETVRQIRQELLSTIPILIASAYDWNEIEQEALEIGVTAFLPKPLFRSTLCCGLQKYVLGNTTASLAHKREKQYDFTGKRLLLAEDNELNREIAVELLTEVGAEIQTVNNGLECIEAFEEAPVGHYNLILMDVRMPVMDGYTATKKIRQLEREDAATIPILAMTADAFAEDIAAAFEAGMNGHLSKPLDVMAMKSEISKLI